VILLAWLSACGQTIPPAENSSPSSTFLSQATVTFPLQTGLSETNSSIPSFISPQITVDMVVSPTPIPVLSFAVIGDYGENNQAEHDVADLITNWKPDLIITTGDNNYPDGSRDTIDPAIGKYFHDYIFPYPGNPGDGSQENRFFPSLGNHDWISQKAQPYLDYFTLPGNERYYQFIRGPVAFFALDSDAHEPDGINQSSNQAGWLKEQLALSKASWNIIYFHHPPYSSGLHGSTDWMRWPFQEWGADLVLSGHDHTYERLVVDGLTYIVNGLGGANIYDFILPLPGSIIRFNQDYGAMLVFADVDRLHIQFITRTGELIDNVTLLSK
jgi:tartrate-resistant acid phosphatase type 5